MLIFIPALLYQCREKLQGEATSVPAALVPKLVDDDVQALQVHWRQASRQSEETPEVDNDARIWSSNSGSEDEDQS